MQEVFREACLWVLDKPGGSLSHPSSPARRAKNTPFRVPYDTKEKAYLFRREGGSERPLFLVHCLDQDTSGLVLRAFDAESCVILKEALLQRGVAKERRAILVGFPSPRKSVCSDHLEKESRGGKATVASRPGKPNAITRYRVLEAFELSGLSLLSLKPETEGTRQLRVQWALRGQPMAGDERHGDFTSNRFLASRIGLKRMLLHTLELQLRHPRQGRRLRLNAPLSSRLSAPFEAYARLEPVPRRAEPAKARGRR